MNQQKVHWGTFLWGLVLALAGVGLLGVDLGWWQLRLADLRLVGPVVIMIIGLVVLIGSMSRRED